MGLTISQRKAVTRATATRYRSASKGAKAVILDELCQLTGWHRDHADNGEDVRDVGGHDRSAPGRGTRVKVLLPLTQAPAAETTETDEPLYKSSRAG